MRAVKIGDALQAPDHVGHVRAKNSPVNVDFIDNHEAQIFEILRPQRMVRQDGYVQHIRVGHQ